MGAERELNVFDVAALARQGRHLARRSLMVLWAVVAAFVFVGAMVLTVHEAGGDAGPAAVGLTAVLPLVLLLSFACEYVDSSIGMGYGTTLTPMLLLLGLAPGVVVPAVLVQELISGVANALAHHRVRNADLRPSGRALRMAALLGASGLLGGALAAHIAADLPEDTARLVTGVIVVLMGMVVAGGSRLRLRFSWPRVGVLGFVAAVNKGFMGGGYGPIVSSGQIATGIPPREAVAVTSFAECITCAGALTGYLLVGTAIPWSLMAALVLGGTLASVLGAVTVRVLPERRLIWAIAAGCVLLGVLTLLQALR